MRHSKKKPVKKSPGRLIKGRLIMGVDQEKKKCENNCFNTVNKL